MSSTSHLLTPAALGALLRESRHRAGLSQGQIAQELGITQAYVSEMETGKDSLALRRLFAFMRVTGISLRGEFLDEAPVESVLAVDASALEDACRRYGIAELAVFGSVARGSAREGSDIDLLYTLAEGAHLGWEINDLSDELERILGRSVDLVSRNAVHPRMSADVLNDARVIYAT
jgi:predicted nucleotidyltransferase